MSKRKLYIISGPSGSGKDTIIEMLLKDTSLNLSKAKSYTTRSQRNETDDQDKYLFVDESTFKKYEASGEIIESNLYNGHWYGSSKSEIEKVIKEGKNAIKDVDVNGGLYYKKQYPDAVLIFIKTNLDDLKKRLENRGDTTPEQIEARLKTAKSELALEKEYEFSIVNPEGHPEKAAEEIKRIIQNERR